MLSQIPDYKDMALERISIIWPHITKIMGLALIFYALLSAYSAFRLYGGSIPIMQIIAMYVVILMGAAILIDFSFNLNHAIGWYAMAIGLNRSLRFITYLNPPKGVVFVFSLVMIVLGLNLCFTGLTFLRGSVRGYFMMILNTALMLLLNVASLIYLKNSNMMSLENILLTYPDSIILIGMYIVLLCLMTTKTIRMSTEEERYNKVLHTLKITFTCKKDTRISSKDAEVLVKGFDDRSGWNIIDDGGPVECEYDFKFIHTADEAAYMTVQKWKDSDKLYFTMCGHNYGSVINAYRFYADRIFMEEKGDDSFLVLFNKDGMYMRLLVTKEGAVQ